VKEMTPRQRLLSVIRGEIPDRVPATIHQWQAYHLTNYMQMENDLDPDLTISYHTCGGMMNLLELIPRTGYDFSETLSPVGCGGDIREGVDEVKVKEILGNRIKLMGGINQIQVLTQGSEEDVFRDVERAFKGYGKGGGYIMMASDHFSHAPKINLIHYANAVKEIGKY